MQFKKTLSTVIAAAAVACMGMGVATTASAAEVVDPANIITADAAYYKTNETYWKDGVRYQRVDDGEQPAYWVADRFDGFDDDIMHITKTITTAEHGTEPVASVGFEHINIEGLDRITTVAKPANIRVADFAFGFKSVNVYNVD